MENTFIKALAIFIGISIGNFGYQFVSGKKDYASALERSYFQFIAVGIYCLAI